jgi:hypothetical protein
MKMLASNGSTILLDRKLTASQARLNVEVKRILTSVIGEAIVKVYIDNFYWVDFGPDVRPQVHIVSHDMYCACILEADCAAVVAVKVYLRDGGIPVSAFKPGYFPAVPHVCPVCGARAWYCPRLSSRHRGVGWSCAKGGTLHYWQHEMSVTKGVFTEKWGRLEVDLKASNT